MNVPLAMRMSPGRERRMLRLWLPFQLLFLAASGALAADVPANITHVELSVQAAAADLESQIQAMIDSGSGPLWIGYAIPIIEGYHGLSCGHVYQGEGYHLEKENNYRFSSDDDDDRPEYQAQWLQVLIRVEAGNPLRVRIFSENCPIHADGASLTWLTGVTPKQSIAMLEHLVDSVLDAEPLRKRVRQGALTAIALHRDPEANDVLERFSGAAYPLKTRRDALFWLGNSRAEAGLQAIIRLLESERDRDPRKHATFALSVSKAAGAREALFNLAKGDFDSEVRGEAVFWLGQKGGARALDTILEILARDTNRSVMKKAIFALSQLPNGEGVEPLIELARTHEESSIRGQSLFWLSQKAGKKAVKAIERVLEEDPDLDIKEKAVFALSQLPADEGVPLLIKIARTHAQPKIRKKAIFWLGQSKDPRALALFEDILLNSK